MKLLKTAVNTMKHIGEWCEDILLCAVAVICFPFLAIWFTWMDKHHPEYFDDFD